MSGENPRLTRVTHIAMEFRGSVIYGEPVFPPRKYPVETLSLEDFRKQFETKVEQESIPVELSMPVVMPSSD